MALPKARVCIVTAGLLALTVTAVSTVAIHLGRAGEVFEGPTTIEQ